MIVCIAEKPSVAKDIARIIGATSSRDGYMEGNGYQVTWTFGHLCTLKEPHDYTPMWKSWSLSALPMIPSRFGIKLIEDQGIKHQFSVIERLMQAADGIINCGDAGQEGELIQRWVMQKAGAKCPVQRLWISSMTDEAIREGFAQLKSQDEYQPLYLAGLSRAIGDWILGMNATRLYTLKYGQNRQYFSVYIIMICALSGTKPRMHIVSHKLNLLHTYVARQNVIQPESNMLTVESLVTVEVCHHVTGMNPRVGTPCANNNHIVAQSQRTCTLKLSLHSVAIGLNLPTMIVGAVIREMNKIPHIRLVLPFMQNRMQNYTKLTNKR